MSTTVLEPTTTWPAQVSAAAISDLLAAHFDFAAVAAELDPTPADRWLNLDPIIAAVASEAYHLAAMLDGCRPGAPAGRLAPVTRLRELVQAQRALIRAARTGAAVADVTMRTAAAQSALRVRQLAERLRVVAND